MSDKCPKCGGDIGEIGHVGWNPPRETDDEFCLRRQLATARREIAEANAEYEKIVLALGPSSHDDAATQVAEMRAVIDKYSTRKAAAEAAREAKP